MDAGAEVARAAFRRGIAPETELTISEWADAHRMLTSLSAEPGPWRTARTPYLREIMDALSPRSAVQLVVFMKGSQVGGTECLSNWLGLVMDRAPAPVIVVFPTVDLAKVFSRQKLEPMISATPALSGRVRERREKDSSNTTLAKDFPGGTLRITGANSAAGLRSMPARYALLDEVDAYPGDVEGEGDPVEIVKARQRTFARRKLAAVSTPTIAGISRIESLFEETDQRRYHLPCPHCGHLQWLKWAQVKWPEGKPEEAAYECEQCRVLIPEHHKTKMLSLGSWIATRPAKSSPKQRGYHLSALYSPLGWFSWADCAAQFLLAKGNPERLRAFVNTVLGETWRDSTEIPDWEALYLRRRPYKIGDVPAGVVFLTAGTDVQGDRLEVEIVGWGRRHVSWSIEYLVIEGDPATEAPWLEWLDLFRKTWPHAGGAALGLRKCAVDSGFATQDVYRWTRRVARGHDGLPRAVSTKGNANQPQIIGQAKRIEVQSSGRPSRRGKVLQIGTNLAKAELYGWLRLKQPVGEQAVDPPGWCHFPGYAEEYFRQLTAEQAVVEVVKGFRRVSWVKLRPRNEALDCRILARAAANLVGIDRWDDARWDRETANLGLDAPPAPVQNPRAPAKEPEDDGPEPSGYWDKWRSR